MTKTMGDEIYMHSQVGQDDDGQYCKACNHRYGNAAAVELHRRASGHIAAALSAAGFGLVPDAGAKAWDEGFEDGKRQDAEGDDGPRFTNPYRASAVRGEG